MTGNEHGEGERTALAALSPEAQHAACLADIRQAEEHLWRHFFGSRRLGWWMADEFCRMTFVVWGEWGVLVRYVEIAGNTASSRAAAAEVALCGRALCRATSDGASSRVLDYLMSATHILGRAEALIDVAVDVSARTAVRRQQTRTDRARQYARGHADVAAGDLAATFHISERQARKVLAEARRQADLDPEQA